MLFFVVVNLGISLRKKSNSFSFVFRKCSSYDGNVLIFFLLLIFIVLKKIRTLEAFCSTYLFVKTTRRRTLKMSLLCLVKVCRDFMPFSFAKTSFAYSLRVCLLVCFLSKTIIIFNLFPLILLSSFHFIFFFLCFFLFQLQFSVL